MKNLFLLLLPLIVWAQPPVKEQDFQIKRSDYYAEEWPTDPIVLIENLSMIGDVTAAVTGQCLVKTDTGWAGGQCGTGGGGGLGPSQTAVFQIPDLASTRLTIATGGVPVFHNIGTITGAGLPGVITTSVVSGVSRVTIAADGYINLAWEDEIQIDSTNVGSGGDGEFVFAITHYGSDGTDKRSWIYEHSLSDPVQTAIKFPFSMVTGITPVEGGDYFTFNFAFMDSMANKRVNFTLPADNPGLDERIEFFYFPLLSGGSGIDFNAAAADVHQDLKIAVQQQNHTSLIDFSTAACVANWGSVCWSREANAVVGSLSSGAVPSDVVLVSDRYIGYKASPFKTVKNIWVGSTKHAVSYLQETDTLGTRETTFSDIEPVLPSSGNWQDVKFEFDDGTFSPNTSDTPVLRTVTKEGLLNFLNFAEFVPTQANLYPIVDKILNTNYFLYKNNDAVNNTITLGSIASDNWVWFDEDSNLDTLGIEPGEEDEHWQRTYARIENSFNGTGGPTGVDLTNSSIRVLTHAGPGEATHGGYFVQLLEVLNSGKIYHRAQYSPTNNSPKPTTLAGVAWVEIYSGGTGGGGQTQGRALATQAEAESGTDNAKSMSPLRTAQAIEALQKFIAVANKPTDLSSYAEDQVLRVISPAGWYLVDQLTAYGHAFQLNTELDQEGANVTNIGVNLVGTAKIGSVETVEGQALSTSESPVLRVEFSEDLGAPGTSDDQYDLQVYLRKSVLSGADLTRTPIYMALYSGVPSSSTFIDVYPLAKQAADVTTDGIVMQEYTFTLTQSRYNSLKAQHDADANVFVEFYEAFTTYSSRGAVFDVLDEKQLTEIKDQPEGIPTRTTMPDPASGPQRFILAQDIPGTAGTPGVEINGATVSYEAVGALDWFARSGRAGLTEYGSISPDDSSTENIWGIENTDGLYFKIFGPQAFVDAIETVKINNVASDGVDEDTTQQSGSTYYKSFEFYSSQTLSGGTFNFNYDTSSEINVLTVMTPGTPGTPDTKAGEYHLINGVYVRIGGSQVDFSAPAADTDNELKIPVQETTTPTKEDKDIALTASGSGATLYYTNANPFPGSPHTISRLSFLPATWGANAADQTNRNRWQVQIPLEGFKDESAPQSLIIGTKTYPLVYWETDSSIGIYRTSVVATADRLSAAGTKNDINIRFGDGTYAGNSAITRQLKTLTKEQIQEIAGRALPVHALPDNPKEGQIILALNDISAPTCGLVTAAEATGAGLGLYWGFLADDEYTVGTGDLGSLEPKNPNFEGFLGYAPVSQNNAAFRGKVVFQDSGSGYTPSKIIINGKKYDLTNALSNDYWSVDGLDSSFVRAGDKYCVNPEDATETPLYPNKTLTKGETFVFDGFQWQQEHPSLSRDDILGFFEVWIQKGNTSVAPASKVCETITQAAYTALQQKKDILYCISN